MLVGEEVGGLGVVCLYREEMEGGGGGDMYVVLE